MTIVQDIQPLKVGFLDEGLSDDPAEFERSIGAIIRFRFDEALAAGEVDRPIELVVRTGAGLPRGTAAAVCDAWTELADAGVLVIIGPGITDNCLAVTPLFERRGIPTINFPAPPALADATASTTRSAPSTMTARSSPGPWPGGT
jgi:branched-chain amino acid transport system substrate-binding protein